MLMMPMRCIRFVLPMLVVSVGVWSQPASKAQRLEWPRTFTGQPDFAFTREEALQEGISRATREGEPMPKTYNMNELLSDPMVLDPLGLTKASVSATQTVSGSEPVSGTNSLAGMVDPLMANVMALPTFATSYTLDLSEFKASLAHTLSTTVATWKPPVGMYNFNDVARGLVLQAIVTSPQQYAVINGQRYNRGDSFQLRVPVMVPDGDLNDALKARLPVSGTVSAEVGKQYQEAYEQTIGGFFMARSANPVLGQQVLMLPVTIKGIEPRKVVLDINGEEHELQIKFAY